MGLSKRSSAKRRNPEHIAIKKSTLWILCGIILFVFVVLVCMIIILSITVSNHYETNGDFTERCNCDAIEAATSPTHPATRVTSEPYGVLQDGRNVTRYTLRNEDTQVNILDYGGIVTKIEAPDKEGNIADILIGFDSLQEYELQHVLLGAVVGRYANLIAGNRFRLDGVEYCLDVDDDLGLNGSNSRGFSKRLWDSRIEDETLVLTYNSPDGEGGFPGNVNVTVTYDLTEDNELVINYKATTTKPTVINLTNRLFFNLKGHASGDIKDHIVRIVADHYTPLDTDQVPTGEKLLAFKTWYDMRTGVRLGMRIHYVPGGRGYDTNFVFDHAGWDKHMARVTHKNGRTLDVFSTEPGLRFYTGYHLQDIMGKGGEVYKQYGGLLLEAQHYPNSPNEPRFPSTIVRPSAPYTQTTRYVFGNSMGKSPLASTVAPNTTFNKRISVTQKGGNAVSNGSSLLLTLSWLTVAADHFVPVVVILVLGCVVYRKRNSIRESAILRTLAKPTIEPPLRPVSPKTTQQLDQDSKQENQGCRDEESNNIPEHPEDDPQKFDPDLIQELDPGILLEPDPDILPLLDPDPDPLHMAI